MPVPAPLLYTYRRCPFAMRARMALLVAGIEFDALEISLRDKPAAMLAASPKGTVPVLVHPGGRVIDESLDIMRWAWEGRDADGWWQRMQTPDNLALVALNDGAFKQQLDRYKYPQRHGEADATVPRDQALRGLLHGLEQRLAAQPWLGGGQPCAADLAVFPFVRQFRAVDAAWFDAQPLPATRQWLQGWLDSPLFEACMKKLPAGVQVRF
ncbi:MAG: glutathione S-transferase [Ramlibacter sp.]